MVFVLVAQALIAGPGKAVLSGIGIVLGLTLYHAALGFTGAYRNFFLHKDVSGINAQLAMLALASVLFAPVLAGGEVFGHGVSGAVAPVGVSMFLGAFIFGIGMQLGGGCGSGTLYTAAGGDLRMILTLVFFCIGGFWGSLDLAWWKELPEIDAVSLGRVWGYGPAVLFQLLILAVVYLVLRRLGSPSRSLWPPDGFTMQNLMRGPWPLLLGAGLLVFLNWATLLIAGHPWAITWGLTLWGAKSAVLLGWDPSSSSFWAGAFQQRALSGSVLFDTTSVMNIGIIIGAMLAAMLAGRLKPSVRIPPRALVASIIGGLILGYGARLAYGCNIGAFFSGVASTSLHGWVWIVAALAGNWVGVKLRPCFRLAV